MKHCAFFTACLAGVPLSVQAETLYVPTVHVLQTDGDYVTNPIVGGEQGVSRTECELRRDAWLAKFGAQFEAAIAILAEKGEHGGFRVTCERKE